MTLCHCGGVMAPAPSGLDVSGKELTGEMLACTQCGRPIKLLHRSQLRGSNRYARHQAQVNRAMRAARRMKQRQA